MTAIVRSHVSAGMVAVDPTEQMYDPTLSTRPELPMVEDSILGGVFEDGLFTSDGEETECYLIHTFPNGALVPGRYYTFEMDVTVNSGLNTVTLYVGDQQIFSSSEADIFQDDLLVTDAHTTAKIEITPNADATSVTSVSIIGPL